MPRSPLLPLALLATACTAADARESLVTIDSLPGGIPVVTTAAPIDSGRWSLVHERDIQPAAGEPGELLDPQDIAVGDDGTIAVSEGRPTVVHIYGPDGAFVRDIGHEGEGPGELRAAFIALQGDTLVVQDPQNHRATTFDLTSGAALLTRETACCYFAPIAVDDSGRAIARMMDPPDSGLGPSQAVLRFRLADATVDTVLLAEHPEPDDLPRWTIGDGKRMMMMISVPMQPQSLHALRPDGLFVTGWGGEYRLWLSRTGRDTLRIFGRPWTPGRVSTVAKQRLVDDRVAGMLGGGGPGMGINEEMLRKSMDPAAIPDSRPAFTHLWADRAGRSWIRRSDPDTAAVHLDLFDETGRWLDQVTVAEPIWASAAYTPVAFGRDRVALLATDDDGLPVVRVFRIVRREG